MLNFSSSDPSLNAIRVKMNQSDRVSSGGDMGDALGDDDHTCTNLSEGWGIGDVQCYRASQDACTSLPYRVGSGGNMGDALVDVDQTCTKLSVYGQTD